MARKNDKAGAKARSIRDVSGKPKPKPKPKLTARPGGKRPTTPADADVVSLVQRRRGSGRGGRGR